MENIRIQILVLSLFILASASAQEKLPILKSMQDELHRNMTELKNEEGVKPFFISYGISDIKIMQIDANLGAVYNASIDSAKSWYSRVMIGDYNISDENYDDSGITENYNFSYAPLPLDNNNDGIRRALWKSTNNVFQTATKLYKSKLEYLAENDNPDLILADLFEVSKLNVHRLSQNSLPELSQKRNELAELSKIFVDKKDLWRSMISFTSRKADHYFINSEGTSVIQPYDLAKLQIVCQKLDAQGQFLNVQLNYINDSTDISVDESSIRKDVEVAYEYLTSISDMEEFEDLYYGPAMFEGTIVSSFFLGQLMGNTASLVGYRPEIKRTNQTSLTNQIDGLKKSISDESMRIAKSDIQVLALPKLKSYNGEKILGYIDIDAEGVIPPDTIVLVENGKKINEIGGRTPTLLAKKPTGHSKLNFNGLGSYKQPSISTLQVSSTRAVSSTEAKKTLLEKVEQLGLEYGLLFRTLETSGNSSSMFEAYKVYVEDGREEKVRINNLNFGQRNELLKLALISKESTISNLMTGQGGTGSPITLITPEVILLDGFELNNTQNKQMGKYEMAIPSPLQDGE